MTAKPATATAMTSATTPASSSPTPITNPSAAPPGSGGVSGDYPTGCMLAEMNTPACRAGRSRRALGGSASGHASTEIPASTTGAGKPPLRGLSRASRGYAQVTSRKTIWQERQAGPGMNDRDAEGAVSAASFQLLYTADEAAFMLRVKPRWLKRQAAARKVPFTMLAGSYRFSARHLEEITRMHEKAPDPAGSSEVPRQRSHRHRATGAANGSDAPLRPRPAARRLARDAGKP